MLSSGLRQTGPEPNTNKRMKNENKKQKTKNKKLLDTDVNTLLPRYLFSGVSSPRRETKLIWARQSIGGSCCLVIKSLSHSFVTPWIVALRAPLSMGFPKQEYWSGLLFPSPRDLPYPGIEPESPALQVYSHWWWTGSPGMLQFMGSQRVGHNWATELTELRYSI